MPPRKTLLHPASYINLLHNYEDVSKFHGQGIVYPSWWGDGEESQDVDETPAKVEKSNTRAESKKTVLFEHVQRKPNQPLHTRNASTQTLHELIQDANTSTNTRPAKVKNDQKQTKAANVLLKNQLGNVNVSFQDGITNKSVKRAIHFHEDDKLEGGELVAISSQFFIPMEREFFAHNEHKHQKTNPKAINPEFEPSILFEAMTKKSELFKNPAIDICTEFLDSPVANWLVEQKL